MKTLLIVCSILFASSALAVAPNKVRFVYEPYEAAATECVHQTSASNPYDLDVDCSDKTVARKFTVHLALSKYTHPTPPRVSYELLYWVNGNGATTWFHLKDESALMMLESSQNVSGDAGLRLRVTLPATDKPKP